MESPKPIERRTMTISEVAEALGVCPVTAYEAARRGELPTIRVGKRWLVPVAAFNKMLDQAAK
jgi:excisionase family DNA binding protein